MAGRYTNHELARARLALSLCALSVWLLIVQVGCSPPAEFRLNAVEARKQEINNLRGDTFSESQLRNLGDVMVALFGTPDDPIFPYELLKDPESGLELIDPHRLKIAAGAVNQDRVNGKQSGLYREHCVHCHGVTGDGLGPTAASLNPYPRDFRMGVFKFKSTKLGKAPTRDDIRRILINGIPGTAMPSFRLLQTQDDLVGKVSADAAGRSPSPGDTDDSTTESSESKLHSLKLDELEALVDYVIYLSIRGQVERKFLEEMTTLKDGEFLFDPALAELDDHGSVETYKYQTDTLYGTIAEEAGRWLAMQKEVPNNEVPNYEERPAVFDSLGAEREKLIDRGRELFTGTANCHSCHGMAALGDGHTDKYDAWTEDWLNAVKDSVERMEEFRALGVLEPRKSIPRNLRQGIFRGGQRPIDIFLRIKHGIEGTSMPSAAGGMPDEDVWAIAEYVRQLACEHASDDEPGRVNDRFVN